MVLVSVEYICLISVIEISQVATNLMRRLATVAIEQDISDRMF